MVRGREARRAQALPNNKLGRQREKLEGLKASVRAKVKHPFHVLKNLFLHRKTRYRGLGRNVGQLFSLFAFANLLLACRVLACPIPEVRLERSDLANPETNSPLLCPSLTTETMSSTAEKLN